MRSSRSNFDGFDNRDVWEEGKKELERRKKRRKRIRNFSLAAFSATSLLVIVVLLRPDYFTFFSLAKISRYLSNLYPQQQIKPVPEAKQSKLSNIPYREYHFTKEDVDKITREIFELRRENNSKATHIQNLIKENEGGNFLYEIELLSGKRIYGESAKLNNTIISVEDNKGIVIELGINQISQIQLKMKTDSVRK